MGSASSKLGNSWVSEDGVRTVSFKPNTWMMQKLKKDWQDFVLQIPPYPDGFKGRGIVVCAGGIRYFTCAWININTLRRQGCNLPIEVWYTGNELSDEAIGAFRELNVICKNARDHAGGEPQGYALKPFAIINSAFKEVLYLDADNNSTKDPSYLFDSTEYQDHGAIFWPDFWTTAKDNPIWEIVGSEDHDSIEQESGQILINKEKCWKELHLCLYFNLNSKYYYEMLLGDKDTFRFAWKALHTPYYMIDTAVGQCGYLTGNEDSFFGVSMVQHDCSGRILFIHRNLLKWDITRDNEIVWKVLRCFKKDADKKIISVRRLTPEGLAGTTTVDIDGDIISESFHDLFGDLELKCLELLRDLRRSELYARFLLHSYFDFCRPGYDGSLRV